MSSITFPPMAAAFFVLDRRFVQEVASPVEQPSNSTAFSPFKPGIAVIIAILTMFFCVTFLILLYAKHCNNRGDGSAGVVSYYFGGGVTTISRGGPNFPVCTRKNSGVNRSLVESLPVFRFASLRGQKDGLECAVCLNRFESVEVLRLLPKCKHAFHVECVDTWLDAHSTCPLCRYRVDPEDLLLVIDPVRPLDAQRFSSDPTGPDSNRKSFFESIRRISGRHSYAGERGLLPEETASHRRSYDDRLRVSVGCFDRQCRKDGLLLMTSSGRPPPNPNRERKVEHRIIISDEVGPDSTYERWSDVLPSDLLFLRTEMVMNEGQKNSVINGRSVSDMTGMSRVAVGAASGGEGKSKEAGAVARWTAWISQRRDVRSLPNTPN